MKDVMLRGRRGNLHTKRFARSVRVEKAVGSGLLSMHEGFAKRR